MRYWKRCMPDGSTGSVEAYSHDLDLSDLNCIEISKTEFDAFIDSLPAPQMALNPIEQEIAAIKARLDALEAR